MIQRLYKYICITTYIQNLIHQIVKEQIGLIKDTLKHIQMCFNVAINITWWSQAGSNRRPPACKAGALPAELWPHTMGWR